MAVLDGKRLTDGAELSAEVAVVGAGPAGIATALSLADAGHRVLLLESGGFRFDAAIQRLGDAAGQDPHHASMELTTRRQIGGASNLWGGRCVPYDPVDFLPREITAGSRWPLSYSDLTPFFQRACEWCVCGDAVFDARRIPALADRQIVPGFIDDGVGATSLERWSLPTNFRRQYGKRLRRSPNLTLVTGVTCTEIVCRESGRDVDHLEIRSLDGKPATVRAVKYVIACGGVETTRLLFASKRTHSGGLGNHSGHLGRWYMGHVAARVAEVHFSTPPAATIYGYERDRDGVYVRRRFTFSSELQQARRLPNSAIWLVNPTLGDASHRNGCLSLVYLMLASPLGRFFIAEQIRRAHIDAAGATSIGSHVRNVGRDLLPTVRFALAFGYERFLRRGRKVPGFFFPSSSNTYPLEYHGEHLPSYESRIVPSAELDEVGMPRVRTHLRFAEDDIAGVRRAHECLDEALRREKVGRVRFFEDDIEAAVRRQLIRGGDHQAGTTRMSARPEDGVVDQDLAVHGFGDLYIASSSTFVTSGQANPTLMIVAFALRLADHLHRSLTAGHPAARPESRPAGAAGS